MKFKQIHITSDATGLWEQTTSHYIDREVDETIFDDCPHLNKLDTKTTHVNNKDGYYVNLFQVYEVNNDFRLIVKGGPHKRSQKNNIASCQIKLLKGDFVYCLISNNKINK
jgi:hypothetical protein